MSSRHEKTIEQLLTNSAYTGTVYAAPYHDLSGDRAIGMYPAPDEQDAKATLTDPEIETFEIFQVRNRANTWLDARKDSVIVKDTLSLEDEPAPGLLQVRLRSTPEWIGKDDQDRHEFSCRVLCWAYE